jgi:capsular polysaccharide biosynthesis protein
MINTILTLLILLVPTGVVIWFGYKKIYKKGQTFFFRMHSVSSIFFGMIIISMARSVLIDPSTTMAVQFAFIVLIILQIGLLLLSIFLQKTIDKRNQK